MTIANKKLLKRLELYNLHEIAEISGISVYSLRRYIKEGQLKARKIGREFRCTTREVMSFIGVSEKELES